MERGIGFEPTHPRVEALVHSLFYVTPACARILCQEYKKSNIFLVETLLQIHSMSLYENPQNPDFSLISLYTFLEHTCFSAR